MHSDKVPPSFIKRLVKRGDIHTSIRGAKEFIIRPVESINFKLSLQLKLVDHRITVGDSFTGS
jgi:hypothetical protein